MKRPGESYLKYKMGFPIQGFPIRKILKECLVCNTEFEGSKLEKFCSLCSPSKRFSGKSWHTEGRELVRFKVRARDKFTCQSCGLVRLPEEVDAYNKKYGKGKMKSLDVHHLHGMCGKLTKAYENSNEMEKMITLCHKCHYNHHQFSRNLNRIT